LAIEIERRNAVELIPQKQVEAASLYIAEWLRTPQKPSKWQVSVLQRRNMRKVQETSGPRGKDFGAKLGPNIGGFILPEASESRVACDATEKTLNPWVVGSIPTGRCSPRTEVIRMARFLRPFATLILFPYLFRSAFR
jgi:hypothetical protein